MIEIDTMPVVISIEISSKIFSTHNDFESQNIFQFTIFQNKNWISGSALKFFYTIGRNREDVSNWINKSTIYCLKIVTEMTNDK